MHLRLGQKVAVQNSLYSISVLLFLKMCDGKMTKAIKAHIPTKSCLDPIPFSTRPYPNSFLSCLVSRGSGVTMKRKDTYWFSPEIVLPWTNQRFGYCVHLYCRLERANWRLKTASMRRCRESVSCSIIGLIVFHFIDKNLCTDGCWKSCRFSLWAAKIWLATWPQLLHRGANHHKKRQLTNQFILIWFSVFGFKAKTVIKSVTSQFSNQTGKGFPLSFCSSIKRFKGRSTWETAETTGEVRLFRRGHKDWEQSLHRNATRFQQTGRRSWTICSLLVI